MVKILKFFEANLDLGELDKNLGSEKRGQILVRKLSDPEEKFGFAPEGSEPFDSEIRNANDIVSNITTNGDYDAIKARSFFKPKRNYVPVIRTAGSAKFRLNDLKKTAEFGASRGSSLGTEDTRLIETIQCYFLALMTTNYVRRYNLDIFEHGDIYPYDFLDNRTLKIRGELLDKVKSPIKIDYQDFKKFWDNSDRPASWWESFCWTAGHLFFRFLPYLGTDQEEPTLPLKGVTIFHHSDYVGPDSIPQKLKKQFKKFVKDKSIKFEKWNPSDVYAVSKDFEASILQGIENCRDMEELNKLMRELFIENKMKGISLKKVHKDWAPNIVVNTMTDVPDFRFQSFVDNPNSLKTISMKVICELKADPKFKNILTLRSFGGSDIRNIDGEVEQVGSVSAKTGKISLKKINDILENNLKDLKMVEYKVPTVTELKEKDTKFFVDNIEKMHPKLIPSSRTMRPFDVLDYDSGNEPLRERLISKFQSVKFCSIIKEVMRRDVDLANKILTEILLYALSIKNVEFSSSIYVRFL